MNIEDQEYKGDDGKFHKERRTNWYDNKQLFEMMQELSKEMNIFRLDMKQYNGLKEDNLKQWLKLDVLEKAIKDNLDAPCKREGAWDTVAETLQGLKDEVVALKIEQRSKKETRDFLVTWGGWVIMILGFAGRVFAWW